MSATKARDTITDSACHVLKGAIVKVLNCPVTVSVECQNKVKGRVCIEYTNPDKPDDATIQKIEQEANRVIKENLPFNVFTMERKAAEEKYTKDKVNNTYIYDKFPVPEFDIAASAAEDPKKKKGGAQQQQAQVVSPLDEKRARLAATNVNDLTNRIVQLVLSSASDKQQLESKTIPEIQILLNNLKNNAYTNGYNAK
ncbi:hypothetical protein SAMD00019534_090660 [Acytostelium subglobosum LB1]|uniref:hypothetical protein n=1 Tax=Acytostelium subglobosum LB1 TaxID=1410327 RepID=UPI0006449FE7|nr:hypothetical protein SAMD00019534_090660 [Acytostelium subglobosum LB1]GAM25891.1 hypothetical protein SAMD00019534_090660 [Acytostelium subglobosum LB1]|eukprot:XP_012750934.1 hypothetical protein SAMD00019534_090660 [Acytostelium subglobosum LB1]